MERNLNIDRVCLYIAHFDRLNVTRQAECGTSKLYVTSPSAVRLSPVEALVKPL